MDDSKRGFNFLVGVGVLWLLTRLYLNGVLDDIGLLFSTYMAGDDTSMLYSGPDAVMRNPAALISTLLIELVITVGTLATLVLSGLWRVILILVAWLNDIAVVGLAYLQEMRAKNLPDKGEPGTATAGVVAEAAPVVVAQSTVAVSPEATPGQAISIALINTRQQISELSNSLVKLDARENEHMTAIMKALGDLQNQTAAVSSALTNMQKDLAEKGNAPSSPAASPESNPAPGIEG